MIVRGKDGLQSSREPRLESFAVIDAVASRLDDSDRIVSRRAA